MKSILHPVTEAKLSAFIYRFRFLVLYIIFGVMSLLLEFIIRFYAISLGINNTLSILLSLFMGILFAFWANVKFNFKIPKSRRNRALLYFMCISFFSGFLQWTLKYFLPIYSLSYELNRLVISACVFMLAYIFHKKYTFRDYKKVGVAIYANGVEDLNNIYGEIGHYPDFIHVDIIDKTMNENAKDVKTYRLETMRAYWPNIQIQTHIMSQYPSHWLDQVLPYSDVIYIHAECNENLESLLKIIKKEGKKAGIALTMETKPNAVKELLKEADSILLLTIPEAGSSGQKFDMDGLERIKQVNSLPFRNQLTLCIDGGVNENIVGILEAENLVSGSSVLKNPNPKKHIMRLQTMGRYETT